MVKKGKCLRYNIKEPYLKTCNSKCKIKEDIKNKEKRKIKNVIQKDQPQVVLVRLEVDPTIQHKNFKGKLNSDLKLAALKRGSNYSNKKKKPFDGLKESNVNKTKYNFSAFPELEIQKGSTVNEIPFDFSSNNICHHSDTSKTDNLKSSDVISLHVCKDCNSVKIRPGERLSHNVCISSPKASTNKNQTVKTHPNQVKVSEPEEALNNICDSHSEEVTGMPSLSDLGKRFSKGISCSSVEHPGKIITKRKLFQDVEKPITLISKLSGCQVSPSKMKILPVTTNSFVDHELRTSTPLNTSEDKCNTEVTFDSVNGTFNHNNGYKSVGDKDKFLIECDSIDSSYEKEDVIDEARTVYDVMDFISVGMPSWNLHILSDTNTFCICQVSRNKNGIPHVSKCIELDDNFNGKVYIYQQHCKKFDGVYDNEGALVELIKEVDKVQ